jgi:protein gp37
MSDFFRPQVPFEFLQQIFATMEKAEWHQFFVLTKYTEHLVEVAPYLPWPKNVWLGVSVETPTYYPRIHQLVTVPAAVRFLSLSPIMAPMPNLPLDAIDWVLVSGEAGPGLKPVSEAWVLQVKDQCDAAGVPFYFNQWGGASKLASGRELLGQTWDAMPPMGFVRPGWTPTSPMPVPLAA